MDAEMGTRRARAFWAYSLLEQKEVADRAGLKYDRLRAILAPKNKSEVHIEELWRIADACGVPREYAEVGFDPAPRENLATKLEVLLDRVDRVEAEQARLLNRAPASSLRQALRRVAEGGELELEELEQAPPGRGRRGRGARSADG